MDDMILVKSCFDPMRWYAGCEGQKFKRIPDSQEDNNKEWKTRDQNGYINFIQFRDGEIVK